MARKRKGRLINGILLVDKPQAPSSNQVVQRIKRLYKAAKAGHTGALDPLATGLLPVCLGEATKFSQFLLNADKSYFVTAKLGQRTNTSDADGEIVESNPVNVSEADIKQALEQFRGPIKQIPSMFSALKHEGKPLYFYARQGIEIERPAREITIHSIEWAGLQGDELSLNISCSKGTYIRTLIDDLGQVLACGAHVIALRRTSVANYKASQMIRFETLEQIIDDIRVNTDKNDGETVDDEQDFSLLDDLLLPMDTPILHFDAIELNEQDTLFFQQGRNWKVAGEFAEDQMVRVYEQSNKRFLGVAIITIGNMLQPKKVVVY